MVAYVLRHLLSPVPVYLLTLSQISRLCGNRRTTCVSLSLRLLRGSEEMHLPEEAG
jgi:hypothetical protein